MFARLWILSVTSLVFAPKLLPYVRIALRVAGEAGVL
jgi:hypothetical protein